MKIPAEGGAPVVVPSALGSDPGAGPLNYAKAIAIDAAGNVFVSDADFIRKITPAGAVSAFAQGVRAQGLAIDATGNVHATTCGIRAGTGVPPPATQLVKFTPQGAATVLAGSKAEVGFADGPGTQALFGPGEYGGCPTTGIALDGAGNVWLADQGNNIVRRIAPDGQVRAIVGQPGRKGNTLGALPATLAAPTDVSFDGAGNLVVGTADAILKVRFGD